MASIDIDIRGLKELQKKLKVESIAELNEWASKIVQRVVSQMSLRQDQIHLRFVERGPREFDIEFRASQDHVQPIRQAIKELAPDMPVRTSAIFQALLEGIEKEKNTKK